MAMSKKDSLRLFREGADALAAQEGALTAAEWDAFYDEACGAWAAEMAYERHLEDRGWMDSFEEEDRIRRGW